MKELIWFLGLYIFLIFPVGAVEFDLNSQNAILYNLDEDKILYEKNSDEIVAIASLTKIMTGIIAVENINDLDTEVTLINKDFETLVESNASVAGFHPNQKVTYRDLLYGLLLPSGADAAQALTRLIAQGRDNFVDMMNAKALELGMVDTHFVNETGLDKVGQTSTVKDVAIMLKYALTNDTLKNILETKNYQTTDKSLTFYSTINSSIKKVDANMDYVLGGKTGTTKNAGRCLASIANFNDTNFILVTVRAPQGTTPYNVMDAKTIYDYFKENYHKEKIINKDMTILTLNTALAKEKQIDFSSSFDLYKYVPNDYTFNDLNITYDGLDVIPYNTKENTYLGTLTINYDNEKITDIDIILENKLHVDILSFLLYYKYLIIILSFLIILTIYLILKVKKHLIKNK